MREDPIKIEVIDSAEAGGPDAVSGAGNLSLETGEEQAPKILDPSGQIIRTAKQVERSRAYRIYILLPVIFLTVALLGGLRLASLDGAFVFVAPALVSLIFGLVLFALFIRAGLIDIRGWFSDEYSIVHNAANGVVLATAYASSVQVFNSLLPEAGLPFWVVAFCFAWTLWNNLFAEFDNKRLLRSLAAIFAFAFVAKYVVLANLTAPANDAGWLRSMLENPAREAFTWLLDLPRYSAGTGYIQFFCMGLYFLGLFLLPRSVREQNY
ncbi:MAG TPA: hypothetical protein PKD26_01960 [Pyrinomonadaceae bacterium]|nr:hypothetical protein [Pyrinomonadaceae bacterium]